MKKNNFNWLCFLGDATLSRHSGINMKEISFEVKIANTPSGEVC